MPHRSRSKSFAATVGAILATGMWCSGDAAAQTATPHVKPLNGAVGTYAGNQTTTLSFSFGHGFTRIDGIRIDWAGSVQPGTCESAGGPYPCGGEIIAYLPGDGFGFWLASTTGPAFDEEVPLDPLANQSTTFLRDGAGTITLGLGSIGIPPEDSVVVWPEGEITRANLIVVGVPASTTCGDGAIDPLEYCDDGNTAPGDGCDELCVVEHFFECSGEPSVCTGSAVGIRMVVPSDTVPLSGTRGPVDVVADAAGNVFVAFSISDHVVRITPDDEASVFLDTVDPFGSLHSPSYLAVDGAGDLFVAESSNTLPDRVLRRAPDGTMTLVLDETGDGGANPLGIPLGLGVDAEEHLYVAGAQHLFEVPPGGVPSVLLDETGDGVTAPIALHAPAIDGDGNVYVPDYAGDVVFRVTPLGEVGVFVDATGNGSGHPISGPRSVLAGPDGTLYISNQHDDNVLAVDPAGTVTQVLGPEGDGLGNALDAPWALAMDPAGRLYVGGAASDNVFEVDLPDGGAVRAILDPQGDGEGNGFDNPRGIAVAREGVVYVAGTQSLNVFKITLDHPAGPRPLPALGAAMVGLLAAGLGVLGAWRARAPAARRRAATRRCGGT